jgi:hypothetical protein
MGALCFILTARAYRITDCPAWDFAIHQQERMRNSSKKIVLVLLAALLACLNRAEAAEWELRELPEVLDPSCDCECAVRKGAAEISVPGTVHDLSAELGQMNAPRALCELEGDFSVRVKTDCELSPRTRTIEERKPYHGASLVLMQNDAYYMRLDRAACFDEADNTVHKYANFELRSSFDLDGSTPSEPSILNSFGIDEDHTRYLRLDRVGDKVAGYVSSDGAKWLYLGRKIAKFPAKVKVGVAVVNTAKEPLTVRFSEFGTAPRAAEASRHAAVKPLTNEQQEKLLATRLHGGIGCTFRRGAQLFLISSRIELPFGVALVTSSPTIATTELHPVFPTFYRPTLREYLDAIALQTDSEWKYDPTGKFFKSEVENGPAEDLAMFEFIGTERVSSFQVAVPEGCKTFDKGSCVMYLLPGNQVGLAIGGQGTYSSDDGTKQNDLLRKVVAELSLESAKRFKGDADVKDLKPAKVGPYDALYFEAMLPLPNGGKCHLRQWAFSVENKCYSAVSAILPQFEERILPDVQAMLKSFRLRKAEAGGSNR